jgi:hypothetical protein
MEQLAVNSTGYDTGRSVWLYRKVGASGWQSWPATMPAMVLACAASCPAVDPTLDAVYGFDDGGAGHIALYRIKLDGSLARERVLGRSDVDVDELLTIGRNHRVVGVSYAPKSGWSNSSIQRSRRGGACTRPCRAAADQLQMLRPTKAAAASGWWGHRSGHVLCLRQETRKLEQVLGLRPNWRA